MSPKKSFFIIFICSFFLSSLLFISSLDQDLFAYYYIGKGVAKGMDMYRDFAEVKGPVNHIFFTLLYLVFNDNISLAFVTASTIIDAVVIYILTAIARKFIARHGAKPLVRARDLVFLTAWYKSFFLFGGIYSESIALFFLVISFYLWLKDRFFLSGIVIGLSVLTRMSTGVFIVYFIIAFLLDKKNSRPLIAFFSGLAIPISITIIYFYLNGTLWYFYYNTFAWMVAYSSTIMERKLVNIIYSLIAYPYITMSLLLPTVCIVLLGACSLLKKNILIKLIAIASVSVLSITGGGIVYVHHFSQLSVIFFLLWLMQYQTKYSSYIYILKVSVITFLIVYYYSFITIANKGFTFNTAYPAIKELSAMKYLMVYPYYPVYYFAYEKEAPDRYFIPFFISKGFNKKNEYDMALHKKLPSERVKNSAFMFIEANKSDGDMINEYLDNFGKTFYLDYINTYYHGKIKIRIYESKK